MVRLNTFLCLINYTTFTYPITRQTEVEKKKNHIEDISRNGTGWTMNDDEDEIQDKYGDRIME